jgi:hypothetical protein
MEAQHHSDYRVRAGFRLEIDHLIISTYADVEDHVHDLVNDDWTSVLFGVPDEQISGLPESKMGPKHVAAHINAALRANGGGP